MNPYDHARSSAHIHGGCWQDYHPLHAWFDASKATRCHFTHRAIRHHFEGVAEAVALFGPRIARSDGAIICTETLALQHVEEDCAFIPSADEWLVDYREPDWLPHELPDVDALAIASARHFGGEAEDYLPLHRWFFDTRRWSSGRAHLLFRHHAFGIFEAEGRFGPAIEHGAGAAPTRVVAERHVRTVIGRVPPANDYLRHIEGARWMLQATSAQRLGLDRPPPCADGGREVIRHDPAR
jgi:hypothetical protein